MLKVLVKSLFCSYSSLSLFLSLFLFLFFSLRVLGDLPLKRLINKSFIIKTLIINNLILQSVSPGSSAISSSSISSSKIFTSLTKYQTPTSNIVPIVTKPATTEKTSHNERSWLAVFAFFFARAIAKHLHAAVKFSKYLNSSPLYSQQFPVPEHVLPHTRQVLSVYETEKNCQSISK